MPSPTPSPASSSANYGIVSPSDFKAKSGRDILQGIIDGTFPQAMMCKTLDFWLAEVGDGFAAFEGDTGPHMLNPLGTIHGGWALTLIDSAAGCAAQSLLPAGTAYTTVETKANFLRPILTDTGRVRAEAHAVGRGRKVMTSEVRLYDTARRILAHGTSTLLVLPGDGTSG